MRGFVISSSDPTVFDALGRVGVYELQFEKRLDKAGSASLVLTSRWRWVIPL